MIYFDSAATTLQKPASVPAAVAEANCGDHTCIRTGQISREGEAIVCLPHRLVVRIEGGDEPLFDADAG